MKRLLFLSSILACGQAHAQFSTPGAPSFGGTAGFYTAAVSAQIASVEATGWSVIPTTPATTYYPDGVGGSPVTFPVQHAGYGTDGLWHAVNYTENYTLLQRIRQPYPNQLTLDGTRTAASDYIYASDTTPGASNNSTLVAPKDVAAWLTTDRQTVVGSGTLTVQFVAYHRNAHGQNAPIPYASCTVTDGTHSETEQAIYYGALPTPQTAFEAANSITPGWSDLHKIMGYQAQFTNLGTFNTGATFTGNCTAYPWTSANADTNSILQSSANTYDTFSQQTFYHAASAATPYYVASATASTPGSDAAAGTSVAPFATIHHALEVMCVVSSAACNRAGQIIYLKEDSPGAGATIPLNSSVAPTYTDATLGYGELTIAKDPAATGTVILAMSTTNATFRTAHVRIANLRFARGGNVNLTAGAVAPSHIVFENVVMDMTGVTNIGLGASNNNLYFTGLSTANMSSTVGENTFAGGTVVRTMLLRSVAMTSTVNGGNNTDCNVVVATDLTGMQCAMQLGVYSYNGTVIASTQFKAYGGAGSPISGAIGTGLQTVNGLALVDDLLEYSSGTNTGLALSNDPPNGIVANNYIVWNVLTTGSNGAGRSNIFYDNNSSANCIGGAGSPNYCGVRNQGYVSYVANIDTQRNLKGDVFVGNDSAAGPDPTDAPFHTGNFAQYYGVGFRDGVILYKDASGHYIGDGTGATLNAFGQAYGGLNTYVGTATTTRNDVYTGFASVTYNGTTYSPGAGNGTYTPCVASLLNCTGNPTSPAYQHALGPSLIPYTLNGSAVPATGANAGPN